MITDKTLSDSILEENPVPTNVLPTPKLDDYLLVMSEGKKKYFELTRERSLNRIQGKIRDILGSLSRVWEAVSSFASSREEDTIFDAAEVKSALDKAVVLVGQAQCDVAHQRCLSVLEGLTSVSKAKSLLKSNKEILQDDENRVLFGTKFEDHLEQTSKNLNSILNILVLVPQETLYSPFDNQMVYISQTVEPKVMEVEEDIQNQDIQPQIQPQAQEVSSHSVVSHTFLDLLSEMRTNVHQTLKDLLWEIKPEGNLAGRLKYYLKNLRKITNDPSILHILQGWEITFWRKPHQGDPPHQINMKEEEKRQVSLEIENMLSKGAIKQVSSSPGQMLNNIFLREKKNGTFRPIINLKK